jgi:hypothetical protein
MDLQGGTLERHTMTATEATDVNCAAYHFARFLFVSILRPVDVDFGDRRLDARLWSPRQGHLEVTHRSGCQRLAHLAVKAEACPRDYKTMQARASQCGA